VYSVKTRLFGLLNIFIILALLIPLETSARQQPEPAAPDAPVANSISVKVTASQACIPVTELQLPDRVYLPLKRGIS
jgi:hypothetical protein